MTDEDLVIERLKGNNIILKISQLPSWRRYWNHNHLDYLRKHQRENTIWWQHMTHDNPEPEVFLNRYAHA